MATSASWYTSQTLLARTLFVRCSPVPRTLKERRAVLRALQKNEDGSTAINVEVFKRFEHAELSFIAMVGSQEEAEDLKRRAPFTWNLVAQRPDDAARFSATSWGSSLRGSRLTDPIVLKKPRVLGDSNETPGLHKHQFTIHVLPANETFSHQNHVQKQILYGPWPQQFQDERHGRPTTLSAALQTSIPFAVKGTKCDAALTRALCDWESGEQLWDGMVTPLDSGRRLFVPSTHNSVHARHRLKKKQQANKDRPQGYPPIMKSLLRIYNKRHVDSVPMVAQPSILADQPQAVPETGQDFANTASIDEDGWAWFRNRQQPQNMGNDDENSLNSSEIQDLFSQDRLQDIIGADGDLSNKSDVDTTTEQGVQKDTNSD